MAEHAEVIRTLGKRAIRDIIEIGRRLSDAKAIAGRELENDIRDYIAANPWLISPEWETFQIERRIGLLVEDALAESGIKNDTDFQGSFVFRIVPGAVLQIPMRPQKAL